MKLLKRLALVLCLALLPLDYSNAQESGTTGELITNTGSSWTGCYTPTQEGFWGGYSGGPCPGIWTNNQQYNGNQIIFSYGQYTLSQSASLNTALSAIGSGLQITGYNYHWHVKNSNINGAQPGGYDPIAYVDVTLYNKNGSIAIKDTYNYGYYIPDWIAVTGTRTYDSPYSLSQVDTIKLSVTGLDSGFWAGYYGPEFMHFSLTANYSVDPCVSDPMYSPTCPGYMEALAKLIPQSQDMEIVASSSIETPSNENVSSPNVQQTNVDSAPSQENVAAVEQKQEQSGEKKEGASLSTILSIVGKEQSRIASVEQSVVSESVSQALKDADKTTAEAEAVAQQSSSQSQEIGNAIEAQQQSQSFQTSQQTSAITSIQQNVDGRNNQQSNGGQTSKEETNFTIQNDQVQTGPSGIQTQELTNNTMGSIELKQPEPFKQEENVAMGIQVLVTESRPMFSAFTPIQQQEQTSTQSILFEPLKIEAPVIENSTPTIYSLLPERRVQEEIELPKLEEYKVGVTTPADDFLEPKSFAPEQSQTQSTDLVKRNPQNNELAVGTKIESLATTPVGFDQYNVALKDVPFYQPKEIYKGQKNVDNARALRQLSTDKLHQEMVEQQYRR